MKKKFLNIEGVTTLSKAQQKEVSGGFSPEDLIGYGDISKCGCDCGGSVTGPSYCSEIMACIHVYRCDDES